MMLGTTGFLREEARAKYLCSFGSVDDFLKENSHTHTFVALMKQYTNGAAKFMPIIMVTLL